MPERTSHDPGTPCWADLGTTDAEAAGTFYATIFGWVAEPVPDPDAGGYTMLTAGPHNVGALAPTATAERPPAWQVYFAVEDADAATAAATAAGATVLTGPLEVFGAGRMAVLADPAGAAFALWEPGQHQGFGVTDDPNSFTWAELYTSDPEGATAFYAEVFGWGHETSDALGAPYTEFKVGERSVAGMMAQPEDESFWMPYFEVADPERVVGEAMALGGAVRVPAMELPGTGTFAILRDPQGASFGILRTDRVSLPGAAEPEPEPQSESERG